MVNSKKHSKRQEPEVIAHFHVADLILDKTSDLAVYHSIILRNQYEIKTKFSMLREKLNPVHASAAIRLPRPTIKNDLCFINNDKCLPLISRIMMKTEADETCVISDLEFEHIIGKVKRDFAGGFAKKYREMPDGEFVNTITDEMERWMFINAQKDERQIRIYPAVGKLCGRYPDDFAEKPARAEKTEEEREARV